MVFIASQYNKENRRLKRQSAMMMQQIDPSTLLAHANLFESMPEGDSSDSDKEIQYLRKKVKGQLATSYFYLFYITWFHNWLHWLMIIAIHNIYIILALPQNSKPR